MNKGIDCKEREWYQIPTGRTQDLTNQSFDQLIARFRVTGKFNNSNKVFWLCDCSCGNQIVVEGAGLRYKRIHSCGCYKKKLLSEKLSENLIGQTFNYLTVEKRFSSINNKANWLCKCKCGNYTTATTGSLKSNKVKSCGCLKIEVNRTRCWVDLSGQKFNHLKVLQRNYDYTNNVIYDCLCDCGRITVASAFDLRSGHKATCGCGIGRSIGEENIFQILTKNNIKFLNNVAYFKDLHTSGGGLGRYDFILLNNENNPYRLIEFDGVQHYYPTSFYNKKDSIKNFSYIKNNDCIKNRYALEHNIPLVRIPYSYRDKITIDILLGDKFLINNMEDNK